MLLQIDEPVFIENDEALVRIKSSYNRNQKVYYKCSICGGDIIRNLRGLESVSSVKCVNCRKQSNLVEIYSQDDFDEASRRCLSSQQVEFVCAGCGQSSHSAFRYIESFPIYCKSCKTKATNMNRYGTDVPQKSEAVQVKRLKTMESLYGGNGFASNEISAKARSTNLERYGCENAMQNKEVSRKSYDNFIQMYGSNFLTDSVKKAMLDRYGVSNPMQVPQIRAKAIETIESIYGKDFFKDNIRRSSVEKYGVDNPMKCDSVKSKAQETLRSKYGDDYFVQRMNSFFQEAYGVSNAMQVPSIAEKSWNTKIERYGSPENFPSALATHKKFLESRKVQVDSLNVTWLDSDSFRGKYDGKPIYYSFKCNDCGNVFTDDFHSGLPVCRKCHPALSGTSHQEQELMGFVRSIYSGTILEHDRNVLNGKELDIYLPDIKVAIEYNGTYWHGYRKDTLTGLSDFKRNVEYKRNECEKLGIRLITIDEADYQDRKDVFNRFLQDAILPRRRVFARKCEVREIDLDTARDFCEYYHVNGYRGGNCRLGLYQGDELLAVAVFGKHPKYQNECIRLVYKTGVDIVGGWAKIIAHFGKPFLHYVNLKYFRGENKTGCGYRFWIGGKIVYRQQLQGKNLRNYCSDINEGMSDFNNCLNNGGIAIFDVGNDIRFYNF